jgi:hypothetical protein
VGRSVTYYVLGARVDKAKNNSGASNFFLEIRAKKTMNETKIKLHIQAPWRPGALYLSTPDWVRLAQHTFQYWVLGVTMMNFEFL